METHPAAKYYREQLRNHKTRVHAWLDSQNVPKCEHVKEPECRAAARASHLNDRLTAYEKLRIEASYTLSVARQECPQGKTSELKPGLRTRLKQLQILLDKVNELR